MLRMWRQLMTSNEENLATRLIYEIVKEYDYSIYEYDALLRNLTLVIEGNIDITKYKNLTHQEKNQVQAILVKWLNRLIEISETNYNDNYLDDGYVNQGKGLQVDHLNTSTPWSDGGDYYSVRFPDIFYGKDFSKEVSSYKRIGSVINQGMLNTPFNRLLRNQNQMEQATRAQTIHKNQNKIINENSNKSDQKVKIISIAAKQEEKSNVDVGTSAYLKFNLYPSLDNVKEFTITSSPRLYPDLEGVDLTPAILLDIAKLGNSKK